MPRKMTSAMTFDTMEDEILFTGAALRADPDAEDLLPLTASWLALLDAARAKDRAARQTVAESDAARIVANGRLDVACTAFGDELLFAVKRDTSAARWTSFFSIAVSRFVRAALGKQVATVQGWLASKDEVLEKHREPLTRWSRAANEAIVATRAQAVVRGEARNAREEIADDLTRERDGVRDALAARARERDLPRDWPDLFFRVEKRGEGEPEAEPPAPPPG